MTEKKFVRQNSIAKTLIEELSDVVENARTDALSLHDYDVLGVSILIVKDIK